MWAWWSTFGIPDSGGGMRKETRTGTQVSGHSGLTDETLSKTSKQAICGKCQHILGVGNRRHTGALGCSSGSRLFAWCTPGPSATCGKPRTVVCACTPGTGEYQTFTVLGYIVRPDCMMGLFVSKKETMRRGNGREKHDAFGDREHIYLLGADNTLQ